MKIALPLIALLLAACRPLDAPVEAAPAPVSQAPRAEVEASLAALVVRVEDTGAHYRRSDWGDGWAYDPATRCNTREEVLRRDGTGVRVDDACRSTCPEGTCWLSPYDGESAREAADLQIDHVVALAEAARSGTRGWTAQQREAFANDPQNLVAVSARVNQSKSDKDAGRWRPPSRAAWCRYASTTIAVKTKYGLHVDEAEKAGLEAMVRTCP